MTVGPRINWNRHFDLNRLSSNLNSGTSLDTSNSTQSNAIIRGSGAVLEWSINPKLRLALGVVIALDSSRQTAIHEIDFDPPPVLSFPRRSTGHRNLLEDFETHVR